ncbi:hypothetical protein HDU79_003998 [Rhizoclosmatium sp. JEL0117]|nr:hypothetical protein HDU79_003998 [Rhizoclosmatium sp. JEL0117]
MGINDTHLHKPLKDSLKLSAGDYLFNLLCDLKKGKVADLESGKSEEQAEETRVLALKRRLKMDSLKDLAVDWMNTASLRLEELGEDGKNIIQRGWDDIYLKRALDPKFIMEARVRKAAREAEKQAALRAREMAAQAAALEAAAGKTPGEIVLTLDQAREHVASAVREEEENPVGWEDVLVVAQAEAAYHEGQVPKLKPIRAAKKPRLGKGRQLKRKAGSASLVEAMVVERATKVRKLPVNGSREPLVREMVEFLRSKNHPVVGRKLVKDLHKVIEDLGWCAELKEFVGVLRQQLAEEKATAAARVGQVAEEEEEEEEEEEDQTGGAGEVGDESSSSSSEEDDEDDKNYSSEEEYW